MTSQTEQPWACIQMPFIRFREPGYYSPLPVVKLETTKPRSYVAELIWRMATGEVEKLFSSHLRSHLKRIYVTDVSQFVDKGEKTFELKLPLNLEDAETTRDIVHSFENWYALDLSEPWSMCCY